MIIAGNTTQGVLRSFSFTHTLTADEHKLWRILWQNAVSIEQADMPVGDKVYSIALQSPSPELPTGITMPVLERLLMVSLRYKIKRYKIRTLVYGFFSLLSSFKVSSKKCNNVGSLPRRSHSEGRVAYYCYTPHYLEMLDDPMFGPVLISAGFGDKGRVEKSHLE